MPVAVVEIVGSQAVNVSIDNPSEELLFTAVGSHNVAEIMAAIELTLPATRTLTSTLFSTPRTIVPQEYSIRQRDTGGPYYDGVCKYGRRQPRQTGDLVFWFDGTGGTSHIQFAKETMGQFTKTGFVGTVPDFQNAIGVNGDTVEGTTIVVPSFKFGFDWYPATSIITPEFILALMNMTGKVNEEDWKGFSAGEALFLGPTGQPRGLDDWEIKLHFLGSPNAPYEEGDPDKPGITVGEIDGISKDGHEYLWVRFTDAISGALIKQPQVATVNRVYDRAPFTNLGIGS